MIFMGNTIKYVKCELLYSIEKVNQFAFFYFYKRIVRKQFQLKKTKFYSYVYMYEKYDNYSFYRKFRQSYSPDRGLREKYI